MELQWNEMYNNFTNAHLHFTMRNNKSLLLNQSGIFRWWQIWFPTPGQSLNDGCPPVVASFLAQRQLSVNAGWQHTGWVPHPNYVDPECCVSTVGYQVRCMYWGHLGHFHRAISHLNVFHVLAIWSSQTFHMAFYCGLNKELHCFHVYVCKCWPQTLAAICRYMGIWDVFMLHPPGKIYLGFGAFAGTVPTRSDSNLAPYWACDSIANALELRNCWTNPSIYNIPPRINHYL